MKITQQLQRDKAPKHHFKISHENCSQENQYYSFRRPAAGIQSGKILHKTNNGKLSLEVINLKIFFFSWISSIVCALYLEL